MNANERQSNLIFDYLFSPVARSTEFNSRSFAFIRVI
jgi:hypothetical protein